MRLPGQALVVLRQVQAGDAHRIVHDLSIGRISPDLVCSKIEEWDHITSHVRYGSGYPEIPHWYEVPFFKGQKKIVLGHKGETIRAIGEASRKELAEIIEQKVHLFLFVKVREGWGNDPARYRDLGLTFPKE